MCIIQVKSETLKKELRKILQILNNQKFYENIGLYQKRAIFNRIQKLKGNL